MGRMYSGGKGIASSCTPFKRKAPKWVTSTPSAVAELIVKMAKKGRLFCFPLKLV
jgi:type III secretion system FlhB-like substrate exporter